jgi:MFS transporter, putative metabolite:H+ symporter
MPRVPQPVLARIGAPIGEVRALAKARLGATDESDGVLAIPTEGAPNAGLATVLTLQADGTGTVVSAHGRGRLDIPFFGWFFVPMVRIAGKRSAAYTVAMLQHLVDGEPEPEPPAGVVFLPTVPFTGEQTTLLAAASAAVAVTSFASALFGQLAGPIGDTFDASDATLSNALALTRVGAILALFATALADRRGRRRAILIGVVGSAVACGLSAIAPSLLVFTGAQMLQRACLNTTIIVAGIAVIEESPDGARAYAASMLALAGGFGFSFAVVALLLDVGSYGWRLAYVAGALTILLARPIARALTETTRYRAIAERTEIRRGRVRELMDSRYGRRFALLAAVGFLANFFSAPSSQLMNKYLEDVRDFSSPGIALFRTVTTALPGLVGLMLGGRLSERLGRKPVAITSLLIATTTQMVFFLQGGTLLWVMSAVSVLTSSMAGIALGTLDAELFPTEVRGTSNALLLIVSVVGSGTGLLVAGHFSDPLGGIGRSIALCGIAGLIAAVFFVPRLPETSTSTLDDVSPSERPDEYGPRRALD